MTTRDDRIAAGHFRHALHYPHSLDAVLIPTPTAEYVLARFEGGLPPAREVGRDDDG